MDYAKSKGIEVGGYDLICLDRGHNGYGGNVGDEWVTVGEDGTARKREEGRERNEERRERRERREVWVA